MDLALAENVFANRGHTVRAFLEEDRAIAWILAHEGH